MINQILAIESDYTEWYLFHPADLAHRQTYPFEWPRYGFAIGKEYAAGNLVAIDTGESGLWTIRFTDQGLTPAEQDHTVGSVDFRLKVRHQSLCLCDHRGLPFEDHIVEQALPSAAEPSRPLNQPAWLDLPNGKYHVRVYTFDWGEPDGPADSPSYTAVFTPVEDLEAVPYPTKMPTLMVYDGLLESYPDSQETWRNKLQLPLDEAYALLDWDEVLFPGPEVDLTATEDQFRQMETISDACTELQRECRYIVIGHNLTQTRFGTLFEVGGFGYSCDHYFLSGTPIEFVRLVNMEDRQGILWTTVEPLQTEAEPATAEQVDQLKQRFANYAKTNAEYRQEVLYPEFCAERVAALTDPREVAFAIAPLLFLPPTTQYHLATLSDHDLLAQLTDLLS